MSTVINAVAKLDRGNPKLILGLAWMFALCWVGLAWMFALAQGTRSMREGARRREKAREGISSSTKLKTI